MDIYWTPYDILFKNRNNSERKMGMIQLILGLVVGLGPSLALYFWLRKRSMETPAYPETCGKALTAGLLATFPIVLLSGVLFLLLRVTGLQETHPLLYQVPYTFIVLAFSEELMKYLSFRRLLKKMQQPYSWRELTVLMAVVAIGFGLAESLLYLIGSNVIVMLIRGIAIPHGGYGAIVGWFYGRSVKTGRRGDRVLGFVLAWLLHGLYDFSLAREFAAFNENLAIAIALTISVLNLALIIALILFVVRTRGNETYTAPLYSAADKESTDIF